MACLSQTRARSGGWILRPLPATMRSARALANGTHLPNVTLKQDGHVTVLKSARVVSIEQDAAGNEVVTLAPAAGEAEARKSKGKVEATWKVEEGTR